MAIARAAVARGAAVVLAARHEQALETVAADLTARGGRVATCTADVARDEDVERLFAWSSSRKRRPAEDA